MQQPLLVAVGIPLYGDGKGAFWKCLRDLEVFSASKGIALREITAGGCYIHDNRNRIVEELLTGSGLKEASYLLWLDSDMYFNPDLLVQLLKHNKSIVCTNYYRKGLPHNPVATVKVDGVLRTIHRNPDTNGGLEEVEGSGLGGCLVSRKVFEKVPFPWFQNNYIDPHPNLTEEDRKHLVMGKAHQGEDIFFFRKAKKHGFKVYCDFSIKMGHIGNFIYDWRDHERCLKEASDE